MQVQAQGPVAQVVEVVVDARLHLVQGAGLAAVAVDLCPAGDAGLDLVSDHVALDQVAVDLVVRHRMGARPHDAHAPLQHIDELGQLVQGILAQEGADAGDAVIAPLRLPDLFAVLAHAHGAELVHQDFFAIQSVAALLEYDRPGRVQLDGDGDEQQQRRDQGQDEEGQDDVAGALDEAGRSGEGRLAHRDDRGAADVAAAPLDQVGDEHVGHEVDGGGGVLEFVEHVQDARLRGHGQGEVDELDAVFLDEVGQLAQPAQQLAPGGLVQPILVAVVEKAAQLDARVARFAYPPGQRGPLFVHAHDDGALWRPLQHQQEGGGGAQHQMGAYLAQGGDPEPGEQGLAGEFGNVAGGKAEEEQQQGHPEPAVEDVEDEPLDGKLQARGAGKGDGEDDHGQDEVGRKQFAFDARTHVPQGEGEHGRVEDGLERAQHVVAQRPLVGSGEGGGRECGVGFSHGWDCARSWIRPACGCRRPAS